MTHTPRLPKQARFLLAAAVLAFSGTATYAEDVWFPPYKDQASSSDSLYTGNAIFQCSFVDGFSIGTKGEFKRGNLFTTGFMESYNNFILDASSGSLMVQGQKTTFNILRHGDSSWEFVAHVPSGDPMQNILRIKVSAKPITFLMTNYTEVYSGKCDRLK